MPRWLRRYLCILRDMLTHLQTVDGSWCTSIFGTLAFASGRHADVTTAEKQRRRSEGLLRGPSSKTHIYTK
ncbi:unnamed protein product [Acanthoscelides obtectus]|uniref:Uncharacterized protein n=1 Tax=Acanthoscelides obtectus TaxID=200917 RepID=A0A9P0P8M5_ACAOB|nr:unnamed protein product [Acanthoscelides obtectus]CAK1680339.1 hypothetical protein AOBTE_LOCUS32585 [Acanthoscelides obtectus]